MSIIKEGYTRVSTVLNPLSGYGSIPEHILSQACDRGTSVHACCDAIIKGFEPDELKPTWQKYVHSFCRWQEGKQFIETPKRFYLDEVMLTGECDAIYLDNDELVLVDFKTSNCVNRTWSLQGSAYSYMARMEGFKISRIEFVHLSKQGDIPNILVYQEDWKRFLACLDIYNEFFRDSKNIDSENF